MAADDDQKRESVEHADIDNEKAARNGLAYTENPELEKRITRKCDFHILPWIFMLWLLAFIDRSNIGTVSCQHGLEHIADVEIAGNAKIDGLEEDLDLSGTKFNVALTVFYILYVLLDIPSNWLLKIVGGGRYLPILAMVSRQCDVFLLSFLQIARHRLQCIRMANTPFMAGMGNRWYLYGRSQKLRRLGCLSFALGSLRGRYVRRDNIVPVHVLQEAQSHVPAWDLLLRCSVERCVRRAAGDRPFSDQLPWLQRLGEH
jgi:hypothetical protein